MRQRLYGIWAAIRGQTLPTSPGGGPAPKLKVPGHSFWETARPWLVAIGSTAMTGIGCYVIAKENIDRLLGGNPQGTDGLIVILTAATGIMLDAAIIISATRIGMHGQRFSKEWFFCITALLMFVVCLGAESMTLAYFYEVIAPDSVPPAIRSIIEAIHDILYFFRAGLPPLILAYLSVAVKALTFERADRKRQMKSETSVRLMALENELATPVPQGADITIEGERKRLLLRQYETQVALNQYATEATPKEKDEDKALVDHFKSIWGELTDDEKAKFITRDEVTSQVTEAIAALNAQVSDLMTNVQAQLAEQFAQVAEQFSQVDGRLAALVKRLLSEPGRVGRPNGDELDDIVEDLL